MIRHLLIAAAALGGLVSVASADPAGAGNDSGAAGKATRCATRQLSGTWTMMLSNGAFCDIRLARSGKIDRSVCFAPDGKVEGGMLGTLKLNAACRVTGSIAISNGYRAGIRATVDDGARQMIGQAQANDGLFYSFSAFRN